MRSVVSKRIHQSMRQWLAIVAIASLFAPAVFAQAGPTFNTTVPSQIMDQFRNERAQWTANVFTYANTLFGILAVIEFAWSAAVMLLEKSDLQAWTSALIRKLKWIGAFYTLLLNGRVWIPAIIDSFTQIGQNAAELGALSPSDIFMQGLSALRMYEITIRRAANASASDVPGFVKKADVLAPSISAPIDRGLMKPGRLSASKRS